MRLARIGRIARWMIMVDHRCGEAAALSPVPRVERHARHSVRPRDVEKAVALHKQELRPPLFHQFPTLLRILRDMQTAVASTPFYVLAGFYAKSHDDEQEARPWGG